MSRKYSVDDWKEKLSANLVESRRQAALYGSRLGVAHRLRELERERKRIARKLIEIDPNSATDYGYYLIN